MCDRLDAIVRGFADACLRGDSAAVRTTLAPDAIAVCDDGGLMPAPLGPIHGAEDVSRLVTVLLRGGLDTELTVESVNGRAGLALRRAGRAIAVAAVEGTGTEVTALWIVLNPAKLRGWHRC
jgi:hypothetical protein